MHAGELRRHADHVDRGLFAEIRSIETIFNVTVVKVNTLNRAGKTQRNRRTNKMGKRADTKRALVTLAAGDRIELFES